MLIKSKRTDIKLYPFQAEDVDVLEDRKSVLLAWEMGTGKTVAAIELDLRHRLERSVGGFGQVPTLVIAPLTTLESTWVYHYETFAPHLKVQMIETKNRSAFVKAIKDGTADVYICHWESLRLIQPEIARIMFGHVIADEAHRAKNRKAQQTRALKKFRTHRRTALTGTPATNKPYDLWSILNWLYPSMFKSFWRFYETYCNYEISYPHGYRKFLGTKNEQQLLDEIRPFYRRHLKLEQCCPHHPGGVQPDLPPKYYSKIWVDLTPKQRTAYNQMRKDMIAWLESQDDTQPLVAPVVIAQLVRLQQLSVAYASITYISDEQSGETSTIVELTEPSSKLDALMQIIEDNEGEQIVVFSQFKGFIELAAARLRKHKIRFAKITGDVPHGDRAAEIDRFQRGESPIFLGTIAAGGEGITLTAASTVVFIDRDWSPARNAQAEDRLHRIGQPDAVHVIDIMAYDTVDRGRHQTLELKRHWIRKILGDE